MMIHEWHIDGWTVRMEMLDADDYPYHFGVSHESPSGWWGGRKNGLSRREATERFHELVRRFIPSDANVSA